VRIPLRDTGREDEYSVRTSYEPHHASGELVVWPGPIPVRKGFFFEFLKFLDGRQSTFRVAQGYSGHRCRLANQQSRMKISCLDFLLPDVITGNENDLTEISVKFVDISCC
jgi:hypothetical protein